MHNFQNLSVWLHAHELVLAIYKETSCFPSFEQYGLTSQMRRSAASIATNVAEGCGRGSDLVFARFLQIALGSASELEYQLLLASDLRYLDPSPAATLTKQVQTIKKMATSLIQKTKTKTRSTKLTADS
jgi:four helix bundle protein